MTITNPHLAGASTQSRCAICEHPILLEGRCLDCGAAAQPATEAADLAGQRAAPSAIASTPSSIAEMQAMPAEASLAGAFPRNAEVQPHASTIARNDQAGATIVGPETRFLDVAAAGVVLWAADGTILVGWDPIKQKWSLPGGKREHGESVRACATRELYEETQLRAHDLQIDWSNPEYILPAKHVYFQGHLGSNQPSATTTFAEYRHMHLQEPPSNCAFCLEKAVSGLRAKHRPRPAGLLEGLEEPRGRVRDPAEAPLQRSARATTEQDGAADVTVKQPPAKRRKAGTGSSTEAGADPAPREPPATEGTYHVRVPAATSNTGAAPSEAAREGAGAIVEQWSGRKRIRSGASRAAPAAESGGGPTATSNRGDAEAPLAALKDMNFYDTLGVQPSATNAEIRRAFRGIALKHHPDKGGDPQIYLYLSKVRDILLNKAKREQHDFHGRTPFADAFSATPPGGAAERGVDALPGQRVMFAPVSYVFEKMAGDEAWATQRWGHDGSGYRFDVLAAVMLKRVEASGPPARADVRATRDVYRLGRGAIALGIQGSRLVSGRPSEGGGPASLQQEIDAKVPRTLAGMSAAQMKSTFRAVVLFGCVEFDLVSSWMFCAKELAATLGVVTPMLQRVAVDGLTPEGQPLHAAVRKRLAEAACVTEKALKGALQRLIGGGHWPAKMHLQEKGGRFTDDLAQLDVELEEVCARNFQNATSQQRAALADKPRPDRSFLEHALMELERVKVDQMERVSERHGARLVGLLGDATIHASGSLEALRRAQRDLADAGITTSLKPLAGDNPEDLVKFLHGKGVEVGRPAPPRAMPVHGLQWAEAWLKANSHAYSGNPGDAPHGSYATIAAGRWDVRKLHDEAWATLNESTNAWEVSRNALGLAGEKTTKYLQEELQGFEFEAALGDDGKFKPRPRPKPYPSNVLEDDQFLKHVASQIKEKTWPPMQTHPKESVVTAFANGLSVDWEQSDPFNAYVATRKEWNLLRHSKARIEQFPDYITKKRGCSAEAARAIAQKWVAFTDVLIGEKTAAMEQRRDVDFEQFQAGLADLLTFSGNPS